MDRSFLTNEDVIAASRDFVCIRCATYEDKEEAKFLKWVFTGRNGDLENTVFCMLSPDGSKKLIRGGRGPMQFRRPIDMADRMSEIALEFPSEIKPAAIPEMKNVRLGINVAACDSLPALVVMGKNKDQLDELKKKLSPVAWDEQFAGMLIYCHGSSEEELEPIMGKEHSAGYAIVEPDAYGQYATVILELGADSTTEQLSEAVAEVTAEFKRPSKSHRSHVRSGRKSDIQWETEIPVTDSQSLRAQRRRDR